MKFEIEVRQGEMTPPFYGVGWRDWSAGVWYCYPMPLNLFVMLYWEWKRFWKDPKGAP